MDKDKFTPPQSFIPNSWKYLPPTKVAWVQDNYPQGLSWWEQVKYGIFGRWHREVLFRRNPTKDEIEYRNPVPKSKPLTAVQKKEWAELMNGTGLRTSHLLTKEERQQLDEDIQREQKGY